MPHVEGKPADEKDDDKSDYHSGDFPSGPVGLGNKRIVNNK